MCHPSLRSSQRKRFAGIIRKYDAVEGIVRLMRSQWHDPLNLGQDRLISITELVDLIASTAGVTVAKTYVEGPQGVRGRNSDNSLLRKVLGWEPQVSLEDGLERTYLWIEDQLRSPAP